jgi:hypothetical protein
MLATANAAQCMSSTTRRSRFPPCTCASSIERPSSSKAGWAHSSGRTSSARELLGRCDQSGQVGKWNYPSVTTTPPPTKKHLPTDRVETSQPIGSQLQATSGVHSRAPSSLHCIDVDPHGMAAAVAPQPMPKCTDGGCQICQRTWLSSAQRCSVRPTVWKLKLQKVRYCEPSPPLPSAREWTSRGAGFGCWCTHPEEPAKLP